MDKFFELSDEDRKLLLPLDELQHELNELEAGSFVSLSDEDLLAKIRALHGGFQVNAPEFPPGTLIYRAVHVTARPSHMSRISYPPVARVSENGRLNRAGEVMFYGSFNQFASCVEECDWQVGQFFAVSGWLTKKAMMFNHLGYSKAVIDAAKAQRELPSFAIFPDDEETERNRLLREWQARVFTQHVPEGEKFRYRLPIALKDFALGEVVQTRVGGPMLFSGVTYPSVALHMLGDNVAMLPSEVDANLDLFEVAYMTLDSIETTEIDGATRTRKNMKFLDFARPDSEGNLVWGQKSQIVYPEGTDASRYVPAIRPPVVTGVVQSPPESSFTHLQFKTDRR